MTIREPDANTNLSWTLEDTSSFQDAAALLRPDLSELRTSCTSEGGSDAEVRNRIVDIHRYGRSAYGENIRKVGRNIFPLIIARDTEPEKDRLDPGSQGVGGIYTLFLADGTTHSIQPTHQSYELLKSLAHQPLAAFSILSPYFSNPHADSWLGPIRAMQEKVHAAQRALSHSDKSTLSKSQSVLANEMLDHTDQYISSIIQARSVSETGFKTYTGKMRPNIRQCMDAAADIQMSSCMDALKKWKDMLGAVEWRKLYVVVTTIWPVSEYSPRWQLFRTLMDDDKIGNHLLTAEGVKTTEEARDFLGRIVADRYAARLILEANDTRGCRMVQAISSKTDVVADSAYAALCRHSQRIE